MSAELRCPECGNETDLDTADPPGAPKQAQCDCGHSNNTLAFHSAYVRHRMSDEELEAAERHRDALIDEQSGDPELGL